VTPNSKPTEPSAKLSPDRSVNSPEFRKEGVEEIEELVQKGHVKLAEP